MSDSDLHLQARLSAFDWQIALLYVSVWRYLGLIVLPVVCAPPLIYLVLAVDGELIVLMGLILIGLFLGCWGGVVYQLTKPLTDRYTYTRLPVEATITQDGAWFLMGDRGRGLGGADLRRVSQLGRWLIVRTQDDELLVLTGAPSELGAMRDRLLALRRSATLAGATQPQPPGLTTGGRAELTLADWMAFDERYGPSGDRRIALWLVGAFLALTVIGGLAGCIYLLTVDVFLAASGLVLCILVGAGTAQAFRLARGHSPFLRRLLARPDLYEGPVEVAWSEDGLWLHGRIDRWIAWSAVRDVGRSKRHAFLRTATQRGVVIPRSALEPDSDATLKAWARWQNQAGKNPPQPPKRELVQAPEDMDPFQAPRD